MTSVPDGYEFALCLTHDVDRPYKTYQAPYYALKERDPSQLRSMVSSDRSYWQFDTILDLEAELGVRSSFYFLNEKRLFRDKSPREWLRPRNWRLYAGRYDVTDDDIVDAIRTIDRGGWEVGLHGSYDSYDDRDRLSVEKATLESILGHEILGGRQHYLNLNRPQTWRYHRAIGLRYDASLGSSTTYGFDGRYDVFRPFDDEFVVFPLTIMETALMENTSSFADALSECRRILREARENDAVVTVLWHPRYMNEDDFPGYRRLYRRLIEEALSMGAWIGPCGDYYERLETREIKA